MALRVINHAHPHVMATDVTYKVEHVWIVNLEYMVATVTCRVPLTVKTTHATCRMGHVWIVNLGYMEVTVINRVQPSVKTEHVYFKVVNV